MQFQSTRDPNTIVSSSEAILRGLAPDGGLFVPTAFPKAELEDWKSLSYPELAQKVLAGFLTDYDPAFLGEAAAATYGDAFAGKAGYVQKVHDGLYSLELWHGPTCAFKDYALQLMPKLLVEAKKNLDRTEKTLILVATSGDTGKAALDGYHDIPGVEIAVFFPTGGTSEIQRMQMVTQEGENVAVYAVRGNFDDAQTGVKKVFGDPAIAAKLAKRNIRLSSANSINWGRLVPQIVYYVSSYVSLAESGEIAYGDKLNVVVPTGNFGNILAAYYAKQMGVPIGKLICASNINKVLTDFIRTGVYDRNRQFYATTSPSMDILISSNLERLLYLLTGEDDAQVREWFTALAESGRYEVTDAVKAKMSELFYGGFCDDAATKATIAEIYQKYGYTCDTHTAVAVKVYEDYRKETGDTTKTLIASTASPFKFSASVLDALGKKPAEATDEYDMVEILHEASGLDIPASLAALKTKPRRFEGSIDKTEMQQFVLQELHLS